MDGWVVLQAETCSGNGGLWSAVTFFSDYNKAIAYIEDVVRAEWCTTVPVESGASAVKLADCKGTVWPKGWIKQADVYYAEDGTEAWVREGYHDECGKMIQVVKAGEEGKRVCSNS